MRVLGLDLGSRTLGIALSDSNESIAMMKETHRFSDDDYESALFKTLEYIDKYKIKTVVLGLPKHMNGDVGIRGEISIEFKKMIEYERDVEVVLWDERLTTSMALHTLASLNSSSKNRKNKVDQIAALNILQSYLDNKKRGNWMDNTIYIIDDNGQEVEMKILFTCEIEEKKYVIVYEGYNDEDLYAFTYDNDGNLIAVDDQEMSMIEEVIAAFDGEDDEEN